MHASIDPIRGKQHQSRMNQEAGTPIPVLYTVGHSNHSLEAFLSLLRQHAIHLVADVRSSPYSRHASQFNKETLENELSSAGLSYTFLGHILGGLPQDHQFYDEEGYVLYDRITASPAFQREMETLLQQAEMVRTAVLCGEEDPSECHRRLMLGRIAKQRGYEVAHLRGDGRAQCEASLAEEERFRKTQGQLFLFALEVEGPWRSTRPVSRKKRPRSSL